MTRKLHTSLENKVISGTKQESFIASSLLEDTPIKFKNIKNLAKHFKCSNSSITRFVQSIGMPSFKHFLVEYHKIESSKNIPQDFRMLRYQEHAKEIASLIKGKLFLFSSRRGKSIAKFMNERLNSVNFDNSLYHESWDSIDEQVSYVTKKDTVLLFTLNAESNLATKIINSLKKNQIANNIIILTFTSKKLCKEKIPGKRITQLSLNLIDHANYNVDTFHGYNLASARMVAFVVSILKELVK